MKLVAFTLVLDGMPWITKHLDILKATNLDWHWIIVHGAAMNNGSTRWCQPQEPRLSVDGTTEYLESLGKFPERISIAHGKQWESKDEMVNWALSFIDEPCVLMEIDSDEIWKPDQLEKIVKAFESKITAMQFRCRYFVGEDLITKGEHCYGDMDYEWWRAWRYIPGMKFVSHEPPLLDGTLHGIPYFKDETTAWFGKFDHYAYATESQVVYKEKFYGYKGLLEGWLRLQEQRMFPVFLKDFFPHVKDNAMVVRA